MKAEKILHFTLKENGFEEFVSKGSGLNRTIVEAMERYANQEVKRELRKINKNSEIDCGNCKHLDGSRFVEPCYGCSNYSNHELKNK